MPQGENVPLASSMHPQQQQQQQQQSATKAIEERQSTSTTTSPTTTPVEINTAITSRQRYARTCTDIPVLMLRQQQQQQQTTTDNHNRNTIATRSTSQSTSTTTTTTPVASTAVHLSKKVCPVLPQHCHCAHYFFECDCFFQSLVTPYVVEPGDKKRNTFRDFCYYYC